MEPWQLTLMFNNRKRGKASSLLSSSESDDDVNENNSKCSSDNENVREASERMTDTYECVKANIRSIRDSPHSDTIPPLKIRKTSYKLPVRLCEKETDSDLSNCSKMSVDIDYNLSNLCTPEACNYDSLEDGQEFNSVYSDLESSPSNEKNNAAVNHLTIREFETEINNLSFTKVDTNSPISETYRESKKCVDDSDLPEKIDIEINERSDCFVGRPEESHHSVSVNEPPQSTKVSENITSQRARTIKRKLETTDEEETNFSNSNMKHKKYGKRRKLSYSSHSNCILCPTKPTKITENTRKILNSDRFCSSDEVVEVNDTVVACPESEKSTMSTYGVLRDQNLTFKKHHEDDTPECEDTSSNEDKYSLRNNRKRRIKRQKGKKSVSLSSIENDEKVSMEESVELFISTPRSARFQKQITNSDNDITPKMRTRIKRSSKSSAKKSLFGIKTSENVQYTPKTIKSSDKVLRSPRVNVNLLTPTMSARRTPHRTPTTPKDHARVALSLFSAPESLPCREKEFKRIYEFLRDKINSQTSGFLCINGVPGTGKTATVERVIKKLSSDFKNEKNKFEAVEVNGKQLIRPQEVYRQIWKQLTGRLTTANAAQKLLNERFEKKKSKKQFPLIMVIDEFDCLMNKNVDVRVIYQIAEWQIQDDSRLTIVAIANTLNFFDKKKLFSRMKYDAVSFSAYTYRELQIIVSDRLKGNGIFAPEAVEFVARKVASISGDARRALNICKSILDMVPDEQENNFVITINDTSKMLHKIFNDPLISVIRNCTRLEKCMLRAIRDELLHTGLPNCTLYDGVWQQLKAICTLEDVTRPNHITACILVQQLANLGLLKVDEYPVSLHTKISLCVEPDVVRMALNATD